MLKENDPRGTQPKKETGTRDSNQTTGKEIMDTIILTLIRTDVEGKVIGTASEIYTTSGFYEESPSFRDYVGILKDKVEEDDDN